MPVVLLLVINNRLCIIFCYHKGMGITVLPNDAVTYQITFPISFTTAYTIVASSGNVYVSTNINDFTTTGAKYNMTCIKSSGSTTFNHGFIIAIGRI